MPPGPVARGTSPRVRGASEDPPKDVEEVANIPAGAGRQGIRSSTDTQSGGTSPRVRGAGRNGHDRPGARGNIPAAAGSRAGRTLRRAWWVEHPRGCGERRGSEPRPRAIRGNIPAGAGSSAGGAAASRRGWEHPCGCGEQPSTAALAEGAQGTSPRVRGAVELVEGAERPPGNIPAGAGSRPWPSVMTTTSREHPRGCGEQYLRASTVTTGGGTSPRVWGAGGRVLGSGLCSGNIPAGAGSSHRRLRWWRLRGEHPRGCEEQIIDQAIDIAKQGTSPRVRGAGQSSFQRGPGQGNIPAGAGSRPVRTRA